MSYKPRTFIAIKTLKGKEDFGDFSDTFEVTAIEKGKLYKEQDPQVISGNEKGVIIDDNSCWWHYGTDTFNEYFKHYIELVFRGFDDWHRPVFQWKDRKAFFGSVHTLADLPHFEKDNTVKGENPIDYFKKNPQELEMFGSSFNCEPHGGRSDIWHFNFEK